MARSKSSHMNKRTLQNSSSRIWSLMLKRNTMCLATPKVFKFWTPTFDASLSNDALKVFGTQKTTTIRPKWNKSPNYFIHKDYNLAFLEKGGPFHVIILSKCHKWPCVRTDWVHPFPQHLPLLRSTTRAHDPSLVHNLILTIRTLNSKWTNCLICTNTYTYRDAHDPHVCAPYWFISKGGNNYKQWLCKENLPCIVYNLPCIANWSQSSRLSQ